MKHEENMPTEKDWADRRAEDVLKLLRDAPNDDARLVILARSFHDLAARVQPLSSLDY